MKNIKLFITSIMLVMLLSGCNTNNTNDNKTNNIYEEAELSLIKEEVRNIVNTIDNECMFREMGMGSGTRCIDGETIINNIDSFSNLNYYFENYEIISITYTNNKITNLTAITTKNNKEYKILYELSGITVEAKE